MADADLEKIRKARLAQLQQQSGASMAESSEGAEEQRRQQAAEARSSILSNILLPEAAERLGRIRLVKASRASDVEERLILLAKSGQLRSKVTEEQLKELLGAMAESERGREGSDIVISRRKGGWADDEDDDHINDLEGS